MCVIYIFIYFLYDSILYFSEKNYTLARQHFLYTNDGSGCASMLIELHEHQGYSNEIDLFITQTVLQ